MFIYFFISLYTSKSPLHNEYNRVDEVRICHSQEQRINKYSQCLKISNAANPIYVKSYYTQKDDQRQLKPNNRTLGMSDSVKPRSQINATK